MNEELSKKAHELRNRGFTTGEIADELNVSKDTARWLTLQSTDNVEEKNKLPVDFAINWESLGGNSSRLRHVSAAMADMALEFGDIDNIVGIAISGIPFATMMAGVMDTECGIKTSITVFHPKKHRREEKSNEGIISTNFSNVKNKKVVIVDDVITSGRTIKDVIDVLKNQGAIPVAVIVLIDKKGLIEVDSVPVKSLIQVNRLG